MDDTSLKPWSDNPYAPQAPRSQYFAEKANFAGFLIATMFYGVPSLAPVYPCSPSLIDRHTRDRRRSLFPMHERVAESSRSQNRC